MYVPDPMYVPETRAQLLDDWEEIGVAKSEVDEIRSLLPKLDHSLDIYLQLAVKARPTHVFDATYYHACDRTYRFALSQFSPTMKAWGNYGVLMQEWGRYGEAIEFHHKALELDPAYANAYANIGFCYELAGEYPSAQKAMAKAIELSGPHVVPLTGLGNCERSLGNIEMALRHYEAALRLDRTWANALFMKAIVLAELKRWNESDETVRQLKRSSPGDDGAITLESSIHSRRSPVIHESPMRPFERWSRRMKDAPDPRWDGDGAWGWLVQVVQVHCLPLKAVIPKVFLSYRWESSEHKAWVRQVAETLAAQGYHVVHDQLAPNIDDYRNLLQQLGDCAYFVPILTNEYRRRTESVGDLSSDVRTGVSLAMGRAFDEWAIAMLLSNAARLHMIGLWRRGPAVAVPFTPESVVDVRDGDWQEKVRAAFPITKAGTRGSLRFDQHEPVSPTRRRKPKFLPDDLFEGMAKLRVPELQRHIQRTIEYESASA